MASTLSIGKLAQAAGVNVETIRYYQRRSLLAEPPKPLNGHRRYPRDDVQRVRFVKRAQALGFSLDEVAVLLQLESARACTKTRALARRKQESLERKLADLSALHSALGALISQCDQSQGKAKCPIIEALTTSAHSN